MRKISLKIVNPLCPLAKGVYKITVGGKFYIGAASRLQARIYQHEMGVNRALREYPERHPTYSQYYWWAKYIHENEGIAVCSVDLLQRCVDDFALYNAEIRYVKEYNRHPDSLNRAPTVRRPHCFRGGKNEMWDVVKHFGMWHYYNPEEPTIKTNAITPLTRHGKIRIKQDG